MLKFPGVLCPVATPFDRAGDLYPAKIRSNLARLGRVRLAGYVLTSAEGEGALLSEDERRRVWDLSLEAAEDRPCFADPCCEGVSTAVALAHAAAKAGCRGLWLRAPREYPGGDCSLFFRAVADGSPLPVIAAGGPGGSPEALLEHPNVAAVRAPGAAGGARVWAGDERLWESAWEHGSRTLVSAAAGVSPFHFASIEEALRTRELEAAAGLIRRSLPLVDLLARFGPPGLKHAIDLLGGYGGPPRLPLTPLEPAARAAIAESVDELRG